MSPKTAKLALALLTTSALCGPALYYGADRLACLQLQRIVAAHPGVSVVRIEPDILAGHVTLYGIKAISGATQVSIGTLRLPLARPSFPFVESAAASPFDDAPAKPDAAPEDTPAAPAPAAPAEPTGGGTASADDVVIANGTTTFHMKRIDLAGTPLSNDDLAAILDPKSPDSLADRLKKLTAASIVIPDLSADDVTPDHETHWTEHQILLANVVAGHVAAGSAAGTSTAMKDAKGTDNGTIGAIEATGLDLAQLARVLTTKRTDDGEPLVPLIDSLSIHGGQFTDVTRNSILSFGLIKETGFKGHPLNAGATAAAGDDPETSKQVLDDVIRSFSFTGFDLATVAFNDTDSKDKVTLDSLSMHDVDSAKVGGVKAANFLYSGTSATVSIGSMGIGAFTIPKTAKPVAGSDPKNKPLPTLGQTDFNDIAVDAISAGTNPGDASTHIKFGLKHVGFVGDASAAPRRGTMVVDNLTFDVPPDSSGQPFIDMGYPHVDLSSKSTSIYDPTAQTLSIQDLSVSGVSMGTVSFGLDLGNVSPTLFTSDTAAAKVAALAVLIKGFDFKLDNAGLVDKAIAWQAKKDAITPDQERDKMVTLVTAQLPAMLGNGVNAQAIGAAVGKFMAAPKTLHISAASKTGLGVADMALINTPNVLLDALDVKASANE